MALPPLQVLIAVWLIPGPDVSPGSQLTALLTPQRRPPRLLICLLIWWARVGVLLCVAGGVSEHTGSGRTQGQPAAAWPTPGRPRLLVGYMCSPSICCASVRQGACLDGAPGMILMADPAVEAVLAVSLPDDTWRLPLLSVDSVSHSALFYISLSRFTPSLFVFHLALLSLSPPDSFSMSLHLSLSLSLSLDVSLSFSPLPVSSSWKTKHSATFLSPSLPTPSLLPLVPLQDWVQWEDSIPQCLSSLPCGLL